MGFFCTSFTSFCVYVTDNTNVNLGTELCAVPPGYTIDLLPPTFSLNPIPGGYSVTWNINTKSGATVSNQLTAIDIWEEESNTLPTDPNTNLTGWNRVYLGTVSPISIIVTDTAKRYVNARLSSTSGVYTDFATPSQPIVPGTVTNVNVTPPSNLSTATAVWSGDSIVVSYAPPLETVNITNAVTSSDPSGKTRITYTTDQTALDFVVGEGVIVSGITPSGLNAQALIDTVSATQFSVLVASATGTYSTGGTAQSTKNAGKKFTVVLAETVTGNNHTGSFNLFPTYLNTSTNTVTFSQTGTVSSADLYSQFGAYYSSFSGVVYSVDAQGNQSSGKSFTLATRGNPLSGTTPSPTVTNISDGYQINLAGVPVSVDHIEVYEFFINPSSLPTSLPDYINATYVSGGAAGTNTVTLSTFVDPSGASVVPTACIGYAFTGTNVPVNTFVSNITTSGANYVLTLSTYNTSGTLVASNFLTGGASGSYIMNGLVASGTSPLVVLSTNFVARWIVTYYYDKFGNRSLPSAATPVQPQNPTTSQISSAISVTSTGSIYLGSSNTSVPNIILGTNGGNAGLFIWGNGDGATTASTPSTQILGNTTSGGPTFITKNANIADWVISPNKIENTLNGLSGNTYTGLSGTGTYAFWAGASATSSTGPTADSQALFWVKKDGTVKSNQISISGSSSLDIGSAAPIVATTYGSVIASGSTTITLSAANANIINGMYVVYAGIPGGTTITSGGGTATLTISNPTFAAIPAGTSITFVSATSGAHILTDGSVYASNAYIRGQVNATSGSFTGNLQIGSGGSIYSGTLTTGGALSGAGFILNSTALLFNSAIGTVTSISGSTGQLTTTSASIGGWSVNSTQISKTSTGGGVYLDSGTIYGTYTTPTSQYVLSGDGNYSSGHLVPPTTLNSTNAKTTPLLWSGNVTQQNISATGITTYANFYVTADGTMNAKNAVINGGTIKSVGTLGTVTLDGVHDLITLKSASGSRTAYIFPRAVTSGTTTTDTGFYLTVDSGGIVPLNSDYTVNLSSTSGINAIPFLGIGPTINAYGTVMDGIGLYAKNSWLNVTTSNGIGLWTGDGTNLKTGMVLNNHIIALGYNGGTAAINPSSYLTGTSNTTIPASAPINTIQADASKILITAANGATPVQLQVVGTGESNGTFTTTAGIHMLAGASRGDFTTTGISLYSGSSTTNGIITLSSTGVVLQSGPQRSAGGDQGTVIGYTAPANISLSNTENTVVITGIKSLVGYSYSMATPSSPAPVSVLTGSNGAGPTNYMSVPPLGSYPRQRMVIEDPGTGQLVLGLAIYYSDNSAGGAAAPSSGSSNGATGDLWVVY